MADFIINVESVTWVDIATLVGVALTFGAIEAGVIVAWVHLGTAAKAQQQQADAVSAQHLLNVVSKWGDKRLEEARKSVNSIGDKDKLCRKLKKLSGRAATEKYYNLLRVSDFFEELGFQVSEFDFITVETANEILGSSVIGYWELYEPFVKWARDHYKEETVYEFFQELTENVIEERKRKADSTTVG